MKDKTKFVLLFFLSLSILFGCSKQSNTNTSEIEKQFAAAIPVTDMNKSLSMIVDSKKQYFSLGDDIPLIVENKSSHFISFDVNTHIRMLRSTGSQWMEVKNAITYSGTLLLSPHGKPLLDFRHTDVKPILDQSSLSDINTIVPLRIVIIGEIMNGDTPTGKKVGAYVDVPVKPTKEVIEPTEAIIYSTDASINNNIGKIEGIIKSADEAGKPLPNVIVHLKYHPFFNENNQTEAIGVTKTDSQGKYSFDDVEPGVYVLQTTVVLEQGGSCDNFDLSKFIKVEVGSVATVNLNLTCNP